jgi:hypothetical protein
MQTETIETVRQKIVVAINETDIVVQATVDTVTRILLSVKDSGTESASLNDVIANVASGVISGAVQVGADLTQAATGLMLGVLRGPQEVAGSVLHRISHTSQLAVRETAAIGGDFEAVARGLVVGSIEGARKMGVSRAEAAAAAADGALKAAHSLGSPAFESVQNAVTQSAHGIKVLMKKPELARAQLINTNQQVQIEPRSY